MKLNQQLALRVGAVAWIASIQYYIAQIVVAAAWPKGNGYSWANNTISDLANTECAMYGDRFVCSPLYGLMNTSFILLGITMMLGAYLLPRRQSLAGVRAGFWCMMAAGVGTILVGLYPENTISWLHILGAALPFVLGNVGMILIGMKLKQLPGWLRVFTVLSGLIGLVALAAFQLHLYAGLGSGGMERVVAYPQSVWMIVFGSYVLWSRRSQLQ